MSSPKKPDIPADKLDLYDTLIATMPAIERKGAANFYTSRNGHMFSLLLGPKGVMALRLPEGEREKFLKKHNGSVRSLWGRDEGIRHRARRAAEEHEDARKVSCD